MFKNWGLCLDVATLSSTPSKTLLQGTVMVGPAKEASPIAPGSRITAPDLSRRRHREDGVMAMNQEESLVVFQGKGVRRTWHDGRWYFSIIDVVGVLAESTIPRRYWADLKKKLVEEGFELYDKIVQLKIPSKDGKNYATDCADTEALFRIIQSVPSRKAEPFKRWLAKIGYERVEEIGNPELAMKRMKAIYRAKGYSEDWIEKRSRGIAVREELTDEWRRRGIRQDMEFSILTAEISHATFGMTPGEYKRFKGLKSQQLRDHMNDLELIFTMLGEAATTEIARNKDAQGFPQNKEAATKGGGIAGGARKKLERESGRAVSTPENYLEISESDARKRMMEDSQPALPAIPGAKGRQVGKGKGLDKKRPDAEEE
jgi:DNA-damage-inducible protein D